MKELIGELIKEDISLNLGDHKTKKALQQLKSIYDLSIEEQKWSKTSLLWLQYLAMQQILFNYLR